MDVENIIKKQLDKTIKETDISTLGKLYRGKVRDNYISKNKKLE